VIGFIADAMKKVGEGVTTESADLGVAICGDRSYLCNLVIRRNGEELLIMKKSDIMGIIDEPVSKKKAA
jgi:co-chaperonin GroES (HSP10)